MFNPPGRPFVVNLTERGIYPGYHDAVCWTHLGTKVDNHFQLLPPLQFELKPDNLNKEQNILSPGFDCRLDQKVIIGQKAIRLLGCDTCPTVPQ